MAVWPGSQEPKAKRALLVIRWALLKPDADNKTNKKNNKNKQTAKKVKKKQ